MSELEWRSSRSPSTSRPDQKTRTAPEFLHSPTLWRPIAHQQPTGTRRLHLPQPSTATNEVMTTRKQTEVWLLGHSVPTITGAKLPSHGDVLRRFFYAHKEEKKTVQQIAAEAAKEVLDFWTRARIPTIAETSVRRKITGLFDEWKILSKSKNNSGVTPAEKQKTFQERHRRKTFWTSPTPTPSL
ncbi:hypothetical protein GWK47_027642 [Chionoecetes opilio]|uniref:Uncharacterized protein n=1 Tax=Chionoecetes opilio TaxID=41210 RepID=A0A8J8WC53_CHIOP|nr:hypothetical protein GWK47_027642 [Chionoecetes opilio]